jgi:signal transduction histidine kinase
VDRGYVCTLSALVIKSTTAHLFHVGDARIYRLRDKTLEQLTVRSQRAGEIIQRLRDYTRKTAPRQTPVSANTLVREVAHFIESEARQLQVALQLELSNPLPLALADPIQIQQVVLNLMRNAIEAMDEVPADQRTLTIRTAPTGANAVEVAVSDTGPGLSAEAFERLFHPFFTTKPQGMGLGLSISQSIVAAHQGRLWATPNTGPGVTFHFTLPVAVQGVRHGR